MARYYCTFASICSRDFEVLAAEGQLFEEKYRVRWSSLFMLVRKSSKMKHTQRKPQRSPFNFVYRNADGVPRLANDPWQFLRNACVCRDKQ